MTPIILIKMKIGFLHLEVSYVMQILKKKMQDFCVSLMCSLFYIIKPMSFFHISSTFLDAKLTRVLFSGAGLIKVD